ncbi:MAG: hypothetical protein HY904_17035 [Deltaproteobacteria bacterium]|nr:hypothetical protein [Deltaproteobacteria bacterium]
MATRKTRKPPARGRTAKPRPNAKPKILARAPADLAPFTREDALKTGRIVPIPGHTRTPEALRAELRGMGTGFLRTNVPPILLRREAEEMEHRRVDLAAFREEQLDITEGHFNLIRDLSAMLPVTAAESRTAETAYAGYDEKEDSLALEIRDCARTVRKWCDASGLSTELAALGEESDGNLRLMDAAEGLVSKCRAQLRLFKGRRRVKAALEGIEQRVGQMRALRKDQAGEAGTKVMSTVELHRVKRLLLDVMRYVGATGDALFDGDETRAPGYRLQHINEWRNRARATKAPKSDGAVTAVRVVRPGDDG